MTGSNGRGAQLRAEELGPGRFRAGRSDEGSSGHRSTGRLDPAMGVGSGRLGHESSSQGTSP